MRKRGYTIIEMVLTVALVGILASVILPRFADLRAIALDNNEDAIVAALKEAVALHYAQNVVNGIAEPNAFPAANPFSLLEFAPGNKPWEEGADGSNWKYQVASAETSWYIYCPHYDGGLAGSNHSTGRLYVYCYGGSSLRGLWPGGWQLIDQHHY